MTQVGELLAHDIRANGPIPFSRFMEVALYHPECGYYRRRDPFGRAGDFYTAGQLQPVFGRLISAYLVQAAREAGVSLPATIVELGAGRREMADALQAFTYIPVDVAYGNLPMRFSGIVFSNEFFDAIPVDIARACAAGAVELRVGINEERFVWVEGSRIILDSADPVVVIRELQYQRLEWIRTIDACLVEGLIVTIDYGYTHPELVRFPQGTLMSYKRHQALDDVLAEPGERDLTAHVDFTSLIHEGARLGWETIRLERLSQALLRAGEPDAFTAALEGATEEEHAHHRLQLKTLLYGMGETFRVLVQKKLWR